MTSEEIIKDIKSGKFQPIYFLHGEEPYYIDQISDMVDRYALSEGEKGFNQTVLYGKDMDPLTLFDYLRRYPMMSERQVVILKEAQEMKGINELTPYFENPMKTTVFVVCYKYKKYDMRTKLGKAVQGKNALVFESKKLYDNQVAEWIMGFSKSKKLQIDGSVCTLMAEYLGTDLSKISNELDKLALNLPAGTQVTHQHVQEYIGISKDYNVFELQKAIAMRDKVKLARIEKSFAANMKNNPLIVTISSLYGYFSKVYILHGLKGSSDAEMAKALDLRFDWLLKEYKLALNHYPPSKTIQVIRLLKEYDLKSKGVNNDGTSNGEDALMKELFWKIMN